MGSAAVAVIIPARNEERWVAEAVRSAAMQSGVAEVVVVDDHSADETARRASAAGARVVTSSGHGVCDARQAGVDATNAELLTILDADDRLLPDAVERLCGALQRAPGAVVAYGEARTIDHHGAQLQDDRRSWFGDRPDGDVLSSLLAANFIATTGATCVRRSALQATGPWCKECEPAADWEMWCRLALCGPFARVGGASVVEKRIRGGSMSSARTHVGDGAFPAIERVFSNPQIRAHASAAELTTMRRRQEAFQLALAAVAGLRRGDARSARRDLLRALRRDPRRPREWALLACALAGRLPGPVASRLK